MPLLSEPVAPFKNLPLDDLLRIDDAAGSILDVGFGELCLKFEHTALKWIVKTVTIKVPPPTPQAA